MSPARPQPKKPRAKKKPMQKATRARSDAARKRTASKAAAKAKANGAVGDTRRGKLGHQQRLLRDSAILARLHAGASTRDVAEEFEVTQRTVQRVADAFSAMPGVMEQRPMEVVEELGRSYRRLIADFEAMSYVHAATNPNVSLGAKKAAAEAMRAYAVMLTEIGLMPENLSLVRAESVLRRLADEMVEAVERVEAGELSPAEAGAFFRSLVTDERAQESARTALDSGC